MSIPTLAVTRLSPAGSTNRPLLVLGNSLGTTGQIWSAVVSKLGDDFEIICVDHPGHGASPAATEHFSMADLGAGVLAAVDAGFGRTRTFHWAGVSLGGCVGLQLLLDAPARLTGATIICSGARLDTAAGWAARAALVRDEGIAPVIEGSRERWFGPGFVAGHPDRTTALLDELGSVDAESYALCCEALDGFDVRCRLAEVDTSTLVISGAEDVAAPPDVGALVASGVRNGRQLILPAVGHLAPVEAPGLVAAELRAVGGSRQPRDAGLAVRRAVLGDAHVDRASTAIDDTTRDFQDLITRYAWGDIWTRPGLDRRTRSLVTITALVAGQHWHELELHLRAAVVNNGVPREEIVEVLLQSAIYCSVPSANTAFSIAQQFFAALDKTAHEEEEQ